VVELYGCMGIQACEGILEWWVGEQARSGPRAHGKVGGSRLWAVLHAGVRQVSSCAIRRTAVVGLAGAAEVCCA